MLKIFREQRFSELFSLIQGFTLGALILVSFFVALLIDKSHLCSLISPHISATVLVYVGIGLWVVEFCLYWGAASGIAQQSMSVTAGGVGLAYLVRLVAGGLIYLFVSDDANALQHLLNVTIHQLLVIVAGVTALHLPFRQLIESGFGTKRTKRKPKPKPIQASGKFSFRAPVKQEKTNHVPVRRAPEMGSESLIKPPSYHVLQETPKGVHGTITIPREVILQSLPTADEYLEPGPRIRLKMAYFIAQLQYPTAWLTWDQIVAASGSEANEQGPTVPTANHLRGHWVKIPGKYFISQIPREYFDRIPKSRPWLKLPPVPQEAKFTI